MVALGAWILSASISRQAQADLVVNYNFRWMHGSLNGTPAMAAEVTGHPWSMDELYEKVMATVEA